MRYVIGAVLLATGLCAAGRLPALDQIAGVYRHSFSNGTVDGGKYQSEDILEIVPLDAARAYFRAHLEFFNGHICDISGIAETRDGALVYDGPKNLEGVPCRLTLSVSNGKLALADPDDACRVDTCGARGLYQGMAFPMNARRPIRYMQRLLASSEYADAVKRYESTNQAK